MCAIETGEKNHEKNATEIKMEKLDRYKWKI